MNIAATMNALQKKHYTVSYFNTASEATDYLNEAIDECTVGFGDSKTLESMELYQTLSGHNTVYDPNQSKNNDEFLELASKALTTEIYLTSVNAISETGEMVNIDGTGNRIAGSLFGHKKVYFVIGTNKIEPNLTKAVHRAKHVAAPLNAMKYNLKTPCVAQGANMCFDCSSPERICNAITVYINKMNDIDQVEVLLINEKLGY